MNYQRAVKLNLEHMGTLASEWIAVPVSGVDEVDTGAGKKSSVPVFSFPQGYSSAPSLYKGECCNLCGTPIKNVYWIQHDQRRWLLAVGSECVAHFGDGSSGIQQAKRVVDDLNLRALNDLSDVRKAIYMAFSKRVSLGYGRYETKIWPHSAPERKAAELHAAIKSCMGKVTPSSAKSAVTRWANKKLAEASQLVEEAKELITATQLEV